jgi:riboflavin synthase
MFTGIVEEAGKVVGLRPSRTGWRLEVAARVAARGVRAGDSIAVNGCCLTATRAKAGRLTFDLLEETRRLTNLSALGVGGAVNLERSLQVGSRIGGHFVTGHIDGLGVIEVFEPRGKDTYLRIRIPAGMGRYLIPKGSIAVDGISLTVAELEAEKFAVWIIPTTLKLTCLRERKVRDAVNLEFDMLGKYVESLINNAAPDANRPHRAHRRAAPLKSGGRRLGVGIG